MKWNCSSANSNRPHQIEQFSARVRDPSDVPFLLGSAKFCHATISLLQKNKRHCHPAGAFHRRDLLSGRQLTTVVPIECRAGGARLGTLLQSCDFSGALSKHGPPKNIPVAARPGHGLRRRRPLRRHLLRFFRTFISIFPGRGSHRTLHRQSHPYALLRHYGRARLPLRLPGPLLPREKRRRSFFSQTRRR